MTTHVLDTLSRMRARLERHARALGDPGDRLESLLSEVSPFVESAAIAAREAPPNTSDAWREARSFVWLLAYRLGDQGFAAALVGAVIPAWRDAVASAWAMDVSDELGALMLEGYARGREDHARAQAQRALADALPVTEVAPHVVLVVASGPLDPDGARALGDRASAYLLRRDAKTVVLHIEGLEAPTAAVLAELWSIPSAGRMLGVRSIVSGLSGFLAEAVTQANIRDEGELRLATLAEAMTHLHDGPSVEAPARGWPAWVRGLVSRVRGG